MVEGMSAITTHILDTALGKPAAGVDITLHQWKENEGWVDLGTAVTNDDGRLDAALQENILLQGTYRLTFAVAAYHEHMGIKGFYPEVQIQFRIEYPTQHYHVPLLLNPFGYSTYRGS